MAGIVDDLGYVPAVGAFGAAGKNKSHCEDAKTQTLAVADGQIIFAYRDRRDANRRKFVTLAAHEFIRRFLLHVLPKGLMRIRPFGFLANRSKKPNLSCCPQLLRLPPALPPAELSTPDLLLELTGTDPFRCPGRKRGTLLIIEEWPVPSLRLWVKPAAQPP